MGCCRFCFFLLPELCMACLNVPSLLICLCAGSTVIFLSSAPIFSLYLTVSVQIDRKHGEREEMPQRQELNHGCCPLTIRLPWQLKHILNSFCNSKYGTFHTHATVLELPCRALTCSTTWATVTPHTSASVLVKKTGEYQFSVCLLMWTLKQNLKWHIICPWQHILKCCLY